MINASEAGKKTQEAVNAMQKELVDKLMEVINAAALQGSCKATFYARNKFQCENAVYLLQLHGYEAEMISAKDQRDNDRVEIKWGTA